ncbi:MAG: hypothetical protein HOQ47_22065 [Streptomyces sp.]|nr:hypothetical protein [Streptomyces sp.]
MPKHGYGRDLPEGFERNFPDGKPRCWSRSKKTGAQCGRPAATGQHVCRFHGGNAPQALKAAERRVAEAELTTAVTRQLARLDVAPVDNPLTALAQLAGQVVAFKDALADRVNQLSEIRYQAGAGEQVRAEIVLFERAMDRCNTVLSNMGRLNIDERLAKVSEQQAETLIGAVDALLVHLGITGEQATEARRFLARRLRSV